METPDQETTIGDKFEAFGQEVVEADDQELNPEPPEGEPEEVETEPEEVEQESEAEPNADEEPEIESIEQLAEALEVDQKDLLATLKATAVINGEHIPVTLEEAVKGYQRQEDYSRNYTAFTEEKKAFEAETQQERQNLESQAKVLGGILTEFQNAVLEQENSPEMLNLQQTDPNAWLVRKQQINDQKAQLNQFLQNASATFHENQQALEQRTQAERAQRMKTEFQEKLPAKMAEIGGQWNQETNAKVTQYLIDQGYSQEVIASIDDHLTVVNAWKAMQFDEMKSKAKTAQKKVAPLRKLQKKGGGESQQPNKFQQARARLKKTGSAEAAEDAFEAMFSKGEQ